MAVSVFLIYGTAIGTFTRPNDQTVTFMVMLVFVPLLFVDRPIRMAAVLLFYVITFIILAYKYKDPRILSADITDIIKEYSKVDWTSNIDIHKKISHALDDLLYDYSDNNNWDLSFEIMDKIIDNVKTIALRRF
jgi:hypothetical protein